MGMFKRLKPQIQLLARRSRQRQIQRGFKASKDLVEVVTVEGHDGPRGNWLSHTAISMAAEIGQHDDAERRVWVARDSFG